MVLGWPLSSSVKSCRVRPVTGFPDLSRTSTSSRTNPWVGSGKGPCSSAARSRRDCCCARSRCQDYKEEHLEMSKNLANEAPSSPDRDHLTPFNSSRGSPRDAWRLSLRRSYPLFWNIASARSNAVGESASLIAEASVQTSRFAYRTVLLISKRVSRTRVSRTRVSRTRVRGQEFRGQTALALWENRTTLRLKGEYALGYDRMDLFVRIYSSRIYSSDGTGTLQMQPSTDRRRVVSAVDL